MTTHPLERYLAGCSQIYATGAATKETAYYPVLKALLDSAAGGLRPRVLCVMGMKNQGAGFPDGGLFTSSQFVQGGDKPKAGQIPSRGVIECKSPGENVLVIKDTQQVTDYWKRYNQVLVTNYREFLLVGREGDKPVPVEHFRLAESEQQFWQIALRAGETADKVGGRFLDFLKRVILRPAPLGRPKDLAWFLASYARDARSRLEAASSLPALSTIRKALEDALGLSVQDEEGERFFRSTLIQTLFYGVFAAWVLWNRSPASESGVFDWEKASRYLHVPILRKLFRELTDPMQLDAVNLTEVMTWAADTLNRVNRKEFFAKFKDAETVQYFYEPFLEAFDPELRKQLGVWYTPPEVVKYMVGRVDSVLKANFNRPDGLADPDVYVLDPCCGTGAYLVEVLSKVATTLREQGEEALLGSKVKKAATERVFGFEILPAPFVVAHLQLGLFLQSVGAPLAETKKERAGVYLTNALTGWEPPTGPKQRLLFAEMEEERDAAERVKQGTPILVVIGNPPYNGFAGMPAEQDQGLVEVYRTSKRVQKPLGQGLNDLYVRFFRIAERCIAEKNAKHGIVCYVTNYSWLDGSSHTAMRERFLEEFDHVWVDSLNGDKRRNGKMTPDGRPDPSVFSTQSNREGIQVGTAVALLARLPTHTGQGQVMFQEFWGESKRAELLKSGEDFEPSRYELVTPRLELGLAFRTMTTDSGYGGWPLLTELMPTSFPGIFTARDQFLVDIDQNDLRSRVAAYFDAKVSHEQMKVLCPQAMLAANRFEPITTRDKLQKRGLMAGNFVKYAYRPFDLRWLYWEPETKLLNEKRSDYFPQVFTGNLWLAATRQNRKEFDPPITLRHHATLHTIERGASLFPMLLREQTAAVTLFEDKGKSARKVGGDTANLSDAAVEYLHSLNIDGENLVQLFHHIIAVLHAPEYATENQAALRQDWPRVPLPKRREELFASAELGRKVESLLDPEQAVPEVTTGKIRQGLLSLGRVTKTDQSSFNESGGDGEVNVRWGIIGNRGITMPSQGKAERRRMTDQERHALSDAEAGVLGLDTYDVWINDRVYWKNVPAKVWEYSLGGYQVLKKWLSYRERVVLGRDLTAEEIGYFERVVRRIASLILLGPELSQNYRRCKGDTFAWPSQSVNVQPDDAEPVGVARGDATAPR